MRITRIDIEGDNTQHFARLSRKTGGEFIEIEILCPNLQRTHHVARDDEGDQWSMAECLQETLDGTRGTNSMIHNYFAIIMRLAD